MENIDYNNYWKNFIGETVKIIYDDPPSDHPRKRVGKCIGVTETHIHLELDEKEIQAYLLSLIRRVEVIK